MNMRAIEMYKTYLKQCWLLSEETARLIGLSLSDENIKMIFDKLAKPFHYWQKEQFNNQYKS